MVSVEGCVCRVISTTVVFTHYGTVVFTSPMVSKHKQFLHIYRLFHCKVFPFPVLYVTPLDLVFNEGVIDRGGEGGLSFRALFRDVGAGTSWIASGVKRPWRERDV